MSEKRGLDMQFDKFMEGIAQMLVMLLRVYDISKRDLGRTINEYIEAYS